MTPRARLRAALALFFLALATPAALIIREAYLRLQWEAFHQLQLQAEEFSTRVVERLDELARDEQARPFDDYDFFGGPAPLGTRTRSPLAAFPPSARVPGLIGHFQVDATGRFSAPFVPTSEADDGLDADARQARRDRAGRLEGLLARNRLLGVTPPPARDARLPATAAADDRLYSIAEAAPGGAFERLKQGPPAAALNSLGKVADLALADRFQGEPVLAPDSGKRGAAEARAPRKAEALAEASAYTAAAEAAAPSPTAPRVRAFEAELDPFDAGLLDSGELVLFRKAWRDGQRYVQGLLIDREAFFANLLAEPFARSALARSADLALASHGEVLLTRSSQGGRTYGGAASLRGTLLQRVRLSAPFDDFELIFSVAELGVGAGGRVIGLLAITFALVLVVGTVLMYRLGARQLALARQQRDFIAAVSHELKTPLTAIRMYGEMLCEGWAPEEKRVGYYRFIRDEAERLTRLINNVLGLARLGRDELTLEQREMTVESLLEHLRARLRPVFESAGRTLTVDCAPALDGARVRVDLDCCTQVVLNLTDNALKFSAPDSPVELNVTRTADEVLFSVRDHGPGVPREEMTRIFELFQRGAGAGRQAAPGTGIGLALARRLARAMGGEVELRNRQPGAEFTLRLPLAT
ncbi:MAG: HAMP domain-containing histidine kinase [Gammaproteobacteria bacterium]|nr:HAMP domain-containing histidine kinase [Gammaproteobacteria bacterium]